MLLERTTDVIERFATKKDNLCQSCTTNMLNLHDQMHAKTLKSTISATSPYAMPVLIFSTSTNMTGKMWTDRTMGKRVTGLGLRLFVRTRVMVLLASTSAF